MQSNAFRSEPWGRRPNTLPTLGVCMHGVGPPVVTPFDQAGAVDHDRLRQLVSWLEDRGVDFLVPCGSTSEAPLLTQDERVAVIETVVEAASVPVVAGTGHPGRKETLETTAAAAAAGADAALVVTPFYFHHDQTQLRSYYRELADEVSVPLYLYSVPKYTHVRLTPETVGTLATHEGIAGIKDSAGDLSSFTRLVEQTATAEFAPLVGAGGMFASALDVGAVGGILGVANVAPEAVVRIYNQHDTDPGEARAGTASLAELNHAVTSRYSVAGLKYAMRQRGAPAGYARSPHTPPAEETKAHLDTLLTDLTA